MGFSRQEYWSGQPFPSPVVTSLSLWKPRMPFSGYFFPQFTISMKASACSCHLLCCMPRFRDTTDSAGKGLVCKQRTKEERVDDQSAEDWEEAEIWPALASRELQCKQGLPGQPLVPLRNWSSAELVHEKPFRSVSWRWVAWPSQPCSFRLHAILEPTPHCPAPRLCEAFPSPPIFLCLSESRALDAYIPMISFFPLLFPHHSTYVYLLTTSLGPSLCSSTQISFPRARLAKSYQML